MNDIKAILTYDDETIVGGLLHMGFPYDDFTRHEGGVKLERELIVMTVEQLTQAQLTELLNTLKDIESEELKYEQAIQAQKARADELSVNVTKRREPSVVLTEGTFYFCGRTYTFWYEEDLRDLSENTGVSRRTDDGTINHSSTIGADSELWDDTDEEAEEAIRDWLGDL